MLRPGKLRSTLTKKKSLQLSAEGLAAIEKRRQQEKQEEEERETRRREADAAVCMQKIARCDVASISPQAQPRFFLQMRSKLPRSSLYSPSHTLQTQAKHAFDRGGQK